MKNLIILMLVVVSLFSCAREEEVFEVTYVIEKASSNVDIQFLNKNHLLEDFYFKPQSAEDLWEYKFEALQGDILHLNAIYYDTLSGVKASILIGGKIYKSRETLNEPGRNVVVAGVLPFNDN
ncbi:MAG: hypothetical protein JEZ03_11930 [Bacteroidales bacterium]|nr:hypothetical protein [Bacteroidales bacterium]